MVAAGFEGRVPLDGAVSNAAARLDSVAISQERSPRVAIFGDLYARDNDVMNQGLIRAIEDAGGEALTTPYTECVGFIAGVPAFPRRRARGPG
jgi:predicted nucleotide-binding protein (sugar kinase/HSP70/actin superfamily)